MCGRFFAVDRPLIELLCDQLNVKDLSQFRFSEDIAPGSTISIVANRGSHPILLDATWWLLLDPITLKPNYKFASFNSRSDKLNRQNALAYGPYRESRCIIPAEGFVEGLGDKKTYHQIRLLEKDRPTGIAFGGIFRSWTHRETGAQHYSASIITLPPHPKWQGIHHKAVPLMLNPSMKDLIDAWLDPKITEPDLFDTLMAPSFHCVQEIVPIDRPSKRNPVGLTFWLEPDEHTSPKLAKAEKHDR